jgi:predicted acetyltransferase
MSPPRARGAARPPALRYRAARRGDVEGLAELGQLAYRVSSLERRREFYTDHPRFELRDVRVGELDGELVASLVLYPLRAWVRGQRIAVAGVGSVAVSPEHRRRGVADALMRAALRELRERGTAFSMLYAFRGSFYRRLGYGVIEYIHALAAAPANLPASEEARRVRRLKPADRPAVQALYERVASQGHWALERGRAWWSRRLWTYPGDWVVYEGRGGRLEGYLHYQTDTENGPFRLALTIDEFVAASPQAHRGLAGYLASLADQAAEFQFAAPADAAWLAVLKTAQNLRPGPELGVFLDTGNVQAGAMLRITDVRAALHGFPVSAQAHGEVALELEDDILPGNARVWRLAARAGRLQVGAAAAGAGVRRLSRLRVPAEMLGPLIAGTLSPLRAAEAGLIGSDGGAEVIEPWFRGRPAFVYPLNGF